MKDTSMIKARPMEKGISSKKIGAILGRGLLKKIDLKVSVSKTQM